MMEIDEIPSFIRFSGFFTEDDLVQLVSITSLPSESEVDEIRHYPEVQELTNAFIGDESTRTTHQFLKARQYLADGDVAFAWKIMLL